jgi:Ca2+-transporting ATPase
LISDGFPDLALTVDPRAPDIMKRAPRSSEEPIINTWMKEIILIVSLAGGIVALALFVYFYKTTGELLVARSIAFATLGVNSLVFVFSIRTLTVSFWEGKMFANRWLNIAVLAGLVLQIAPFLFESSRDFLGIVPLTILQWVVVFSASILMFIIIETAKVLFRGKPEWFQG